MITDAKPYATAREMYNANRALYGKIQTRIGELMQQSATEFATNERDWSRVGSVAEVVRRLAELQAFLGDRSAVDQLGIEY